MLLKFEPARLKRNRYVFLSKSVPIHTDMGDTIRFPCIAFCDRETGAPVAYPHFEKWIFDLMRAELRKTGTLRKQAFHICEFLNFILWETECSRIEDVNISMLRDFLVSYRTTDDEEDRDPRDWEACIADVYSFLELYHRSVSDTAYDPAELIHEHMAKHPNSRRRVIEREYSKLSVSPPVRKMKKNRVLIHDYLDLLLLEAKKHDPMIELGLELQSYAGLRCGEVVNLTTTSFSFGRAWGRVNRIQIDLTEDASFAREWKGRTEFGRIKRKRTQLVYDKFVEQVFHSYEQHEAIRSEVSKTNSTNAIFLNRSGMPLTVDAYKTRVKKLFYERFLPALIVSCDADGSWPANAPYIEAYEQDYPGAHMLRHWFTMYLLTKAKLTTDEIAKWRGDATIEAMNDYIHINTDLIKMYQASVYSIQRSMLKDIM